MEQLRSGWCWRFFFAVCTLVHCTAAVAHGATPRHFVCVCVCLLACLLKCRVVDGGWHVGGSWRCCFVVWSTGIRATPCRRGRVRGGGDGLRFYNVCGIPNTTSAGPFPTTRARASLLHPGVSTTMCSCGRIPRGSRGLPHECAARARPTEKKKFHPVFPPIHTRGGVASTLVAPALARIGGAVWCSAREGLSRRRSRSHKLSRTPPRLAASYRAPPCPRPVRDRDRVRVRVRVRVGNTPEGMVGALVLGWWGRRAALLLLLLR